MHRTHKTLGWGALSEHTSSVRDFGAVWCAFAYHQLSLVLGANHARILPSVVAYLNHVAVFVFNELQMIVKPRTLQAHEARPVAILALQKLEEL